MVKAKTESWHWFIVAVVAVCYWVLEDLMDVMFGAGSFGERLLPSDFNEEWMRLVTVVLLVAFGAYFRWAVRKHARLEHKYRSIFENAVEGIFQTAPDGNLITANPALARMFGYESSDEMVSAFSDIGYGLYADTSQRERFTTLLNRDGSASGIELLGRRKDGGLFWISVSARLVRDENGEVAGIEGTIEDITERKQTEERMQEVRDTERRRIARDLHDVVLQDFTDAFYAMQVTSMVLQDKGVEVGCELPMETVQRSVRGLRAAINELRSGEVHEQPFLRLMESVLELSRQKAPKLSVELLVDDSFPRDLSGAGSVELLRVIQEALVNARRHSGARHVWIRLRADVEHIYAEVEDDGGGFEPEMAWGGVGLSAMWERARGLGGELAVRSELGKGTSVSVEIPAAGPGLKRSFPPGEFQATSGTSGELREKLAVGITA